MKFFNFKLPFKIPKIGPELDLEAKITVWIISSFALSILFYLSIIDRAGSFGGFIGALIIQIFGKGAIILPMMLFWVGVVLFRLQKNLDLAKDFNSRLVWGIALILASILGFLGLIFDVQNPGDMGNGGGLYGYIFYPFLLGKFGPFGGGVLLLTIGFLGFFLLSQMTVVQFVDTVQDSLKNPSKFWDFVPDIFEAWKKSGKPTTANNTEVQESFDQVQTKPKVFAKKTAASAKPSIVNDNKDTGFVILDPNTQLKSSIKSEWKLPSVKILKENHTQSDGGNTEKKQANYQDNFRKFWDPGGDGRCGNWTNCESIHSKAC